MDSEKYSSEKLDRLTEVLLGWFELNSIEQKEFEELLQKLLFDMDWQIRLLSAFILDFLTIEPVNYPIYLVAKLKFNELATLGPEAIEYTYGLLAHFPEIWVNSRLLSAWYRIAVDNPLIFDKILEDISLHPEIITGLQIVSGYITKDYSQPIHQQIAERMIYKEDTNLEVYNLDLLNLINMAMDRVHKLGSNFIEVSSTELEDTEKDRFT